jgi:hypothetical protein
MKTMTDDPGLDSMPKTGEAGAMVAIGGPVPSAYRHLRSCE